MLKEFWETQVAAKTWTWFVELLKSHHDFLSILKNKEEKK